VKGAVATLTKRDPFPALACRRTITVERLTSLGRWFFEFGDLHRSPGID
jgi:hypothetical protein